MQGSFRPFPDLDTLTGGLTSVLKSRGITGGRVTILARERSGRGSFSSEIVTCRTSTGNVLRLFCKYGSEQNDNRHDARRGVPYEASVYRQVLHPLDLGTPRFYGEYTGATAGQTWIILECVHESARVHLAEDAEAAMGAAARWIGRFHAASEIRLSNTPMPFLITYDTEYYRGWVERTSLFAGHLHQRFSWLAPLCRRAEEFVTALLAPPVTVIHGEYYPRNILFRDGVIYPVDWESAALAPGEIDLASLLDGWPAEVVRECEREYQHARWPHGAPSDFELKLCAARLYVQFRWLGERPDWTTDENQLPLFERLRSAGARLGLIPVGSE